MYLSVIRGLYDLSIVAHRTGTEQSINLVLKTLKDVKRKEKITVELQLCGDCFFFHRQPYHIKYQLNALMDTCFVGGNA